MPEINDENAARLAVAVNKMFVDMRAVMDRHIEAINKAVAVLRSYTRGDDDDRAT